VDPLAEYRGQTGTVIMRDDGGPFPYLVSMEDGTFWFSEEEVARDPMDVKITLDSN